MTTPDDATREDLLKLLEDARHALYGAVGFIRGASMRSQEAMLAWLVDTIKKIEEA